MNSEIYELVALTARYIFVALMLWILWRAIRGTLIDSRRAAKLRRLSPMTGIIGEFVVTRGEGKARTGMKYPVIREGLIGASRQSDVRIRHSSVRRRHAYFQLTQEGLHLRGHAHTRLRSGHVSLRELVLTDGDRVCVAAVELMLVLTMPGEYSRRFHRAADEAFDETDPLFDTDGWDVDAPDEPPFTGSARQTDDSVFFDMDDPGAAWNTRADGSAEADIPFDAGDLFDEPDTPTPHTPCGFSRGEGDPFFRTNAKKKDMQPDDPFDDPF